MYKMRLFSFVSYKRLICERNNLIFSNKICIFIPLKSDKEAMGAILTIVTKADIFRLAADELDDEDRDAVEAVLQEDHEAMRIYERMKRRFDAMEERLSQ